MSPLGMDAGDEFFPTEKKGLPRSYKAGEGGGVFPLGGSQRTLNGQGPDKSCAPEAHSV